MLVQCICLKMLTDFTLMYTSAIGLVLRRDADYLAVKQSPRAKTPGKAPKQSGVLLKSDSHCILAVLSLLFFAASIAYFSVTMRVVW